MQRITITIEDDLLAEIDAAAKDRGYQNRSEIIRDLARAGLQQGAQDAMPSGQCVAALVYVGDAMEEAIDDLAAKAGELGLRGMPAFMFQEGHDAVAEQAFREIARLTRGAYCRFDLSAAHELSELLRAAAVYAAGGVKALADLSARRGAGAQKLLAQMR